MIQLIGTICCSSVLFLIFRLFPKYKIDTAQAIVFNYFTAFTCGAIISKTTPSLDGLIEANLLNWILLCGALFISIFIAMGISSQKNGMGKTSVAVKMSLALSAMAFVFLYQESVTLLKIGGLILALVGVLMITRDKNEIESTGNNSWLLVLIFFGSAGLDVTLNVIKQQIAKGYPDELFTAFGFLAAGLIGIIWLIIQLLRKKEQFKWRNVLAGILLGIPNYFSIFFLVQAYEKTSWSDSTVLAIMNSSIVAVAAIIGMFIFKESKQLQKIIGLIVVILAIIGLTF
jgi:drug/metabolite transporter (DMT)-like permease